MEKLRTAALWGMLCLLFAACGEPVAQRLRVGLNPWPGYQTLAVGAQKGFFAAEGIDLQIVEYSSLHDMRRAFELGQIDLMPSTLVEVLEVHNQSSRQPEVIFVSDASCGADVVQATTRCASLADLRGKAVAYEPDSLGVYILARLLERAGLQLGDVRAVGMDQAQMVAAMRDSRIDAAITYPPTSMEMATVAGVHQIFSTKEIPGEVVDVIAVDRAMLDADPTFLPRFYAAMRATHEFVNREPAAAQAIMARSMHIAPEEWQAAVTGVELYGMGDQAKWVWEPARLQDAAKRLDGVLGALQGNRRRLPTQLTCAHRPMPALVPAAAPR